MRPAVWRRQSRKSRSNPVAQDMSFATSPFGGMSFTACTVAKGSVWRAILTGTYPDREIRTFDKQESEARAYAADATASTPLLSALAQARGIPLSELVERVLAKADAFAVASGSIIGQRQTLEDRLDACTTLEEVQGITLVISMLGGETA